jgi:hypothetical protein
MFMSMAFSASGPRILRVHPGPELRTRQLPGDRKRAIRKVSIEGKFERPPMDAGELTHQSAESTSGQGDAPPGDDPTPGCHTPRRAAAERRAGFAVPNRLDEFRRPENWINLVTHCPGGPTEAGLVVEKAYRAIRKKPDVVLAA